MKKRTRIVLVILMLLGTIVAATTVYLWALARQLNRELDLRIAAIRAAGEPVLLSDLAPEPIPDEENAALVYQKAFEVMKLPGHPELTVTEIDEEPTGTDVIEEAEEQEAEKWEDIESGNAKASEDMELVRKVLAQNAEALALIEKASQMPECQFKRDYTGNPLELEFSEMYKLTTAARLLNVKVKFELAEGNASEAVRWIRRGLSIQRAFQKEPMLSSYAARAMTSSMALKTVQELLKSGKLTNEQMDELKTVAGGQYDAEALRQAMLDDRTFALGVMKMLAEGKLDIKDGGRGFESLGPGRYLLTRLWMRAEMVNYLDFMKKILPAYDHPLPRRLEEAKKIEAELSDAKGLPFWRGGTEVYKIFLVAILSSTVEIDAEWLAMTRMAQVAIEIERDRRKTGKYPDSLEPLGTLLGEAAIDPFTEKQLLYKRTDKGYLIWSVGPNGTDDGAKNNRLYATGDEKALDDVVWYGGSEKRPRPRPEE